MSANSFAIFLARWKKEVLMQIKILSSVTSPLSAHDLFPYNVWINLFLINRLKRCESFVTFIAEIRNFTFITTGFCATLQLYNFLRLFQIEIYFFTNWSRDHNINKRWAEGGKFFLRNTFFDCDIQDWILNVAIFLISHSGFMIFNCFYIENYSMNSLKS